jgi:hypothetical protein
MTEPKKSFHESFQETAKVSNLEGGKFPGSNMETNSQDPQEIRATGVSRGGNKLNKFPGMETNSFHLVSKAVSTCPACQAVVNPRWRQCLACGHGWPPHLDNKEGETPPLKAPAAAVVIQEPQPNNAISTQIFGTDGFEERVAIIQHDADIPQDWAEGLARLCEMPCPEDVSEIHWRQVTDNAGRFADKWAAKATASGWDTFDIFGVDQLKPQAAIHTAGLVWLLGDKRVVDVSADAITVETSGGAQQSFCPIRHVSDNGRRVLLWDMGDTVAMCAQCGEPAGPRRSWTYCTDSGQDKPLHLHGCYDLWLTSQRSTKIRETE